MPEAFLSLIVSMLPAFQEIEQRLDVETGRRFNVFDNLFETNENATSRILAFLLNPKEAHGQNNVFLRAFIRQFIPEWQDTFDFSKARRESTCERIDILISDGQHWLGIENKIFDAPEQERQAGRYLDALHNAAQQKAYRLIYISRKGKGPTEYSLPANDRSAHGANLVVGAWVRPLEVDAETPMTTANILDWLAECQKQCRAENVAWFLRQFSTYVDSNITGQKEADMADAAIIGLALKDTQNLEAALRIGENLSEIKSKVVSAFLQCIHDRLKGWAQEKGEHWEVMMYGLGRNWIEKPNERYLPVLLRKRSWPAMVGAGISAEQNGPQEVFIGVCGATQDTWKNDRNSVPLYGENDKFIGQDSRQRISNAIQSLGQQSSWWVYYEKSLMDSDGQNISDWRDLKTVERLYSERDALSKHIVGRITSLAASIDSIVIDDT